MAILIVLMFHFYEKEWTPRIMPKYTKKAK